MALPLKIICQAPFCWQDHKLMKFVEHIDGATMEKLSIYLLQPKWVSKIGNFVRIWKTTLVCQNFSYIIVRIQIIFWTQTLNDSIRFPDEYYPFVPSRTQGLNLTPGQMTMIIKSSWSPFDLFFFLERLAHDEAISWCKISWEASAARFPRFDAMSDGWFMGNDDRNSKRRPPRWLKKSILWTYRELELELERISFEKPNGKMRFISRKWNGL